MSNIKYILRMCDKIKMKYVTYIDKYIILVYTSVRVNNKKLFENTYAQYRAKQLSNNTKM